MHCVFFGFTAAVPNPFHLLLLQVPWETHSLSLLNDKVFFRGKITTKLSLIRADLKRKSKLVLLNQKVKMKFPGFISIFQECFRAPNLFLRACWLYCWFLRHRCYPSRCTPNFWCASQLLSSHILPIKRTKKTVRLSLMLDCFLHTHISFHYHKHMYHRSR